MSKEHHRNSPSWTINSARRTHALRMTPQTPQNGAPPLNTATRLVVSAFYKFAPLEDLPSHQTHLFKIGTAGSVKGTLMLSSEGVNGTLAGPRKGIDTLMAEIRSIPGFSNLDAKESFSDCPPFRRLRVRIKPEIVTIRDPQADPLQGVGEYVEPKDWNTLISDPDVIVIDTRNSYEAKIGTFDRATNPHTQSFAQFPDWARRNIDLEKQPKVAMFCTGGVRCEKATALLKRMGLQTVYHLRGGILKYLEDIPEEESMWNGECFVFDGRVALKHGLEIGTYTMCEICAMVYPKLEESCTRCGSEKRFGELKS